MADVIIKLKIMPESPAADLNSIQKLAEVEIKNFGSNHIHSATQEPVAFGLKALVIVFLLNEKISNLDVLETKIKAIKDVNSVEVVDIRRALAN